MSDKVSPVIKTKDLTKIFKSDDVTAVDNINFEVEEGDVFGFLGPNGAGKTTTIKMLCGALTPTSGTAKIDGHDIKEEPLKTKENIGVMPEEPGFYKNLSGRKNLEYYSKFYDGKDYTENIEEAVEITGMKDYIERKVEGYSQGMRKRLALAQALVHEPSLLILDEPTSGLDPQGTKFFRELIYRLNDENNMTIFLSSHILPEVQQVCNRVGFLHEGKILKVGTLENLMDEVLKREGGYLLKVKGKGIEEQLVEKLRALDEVLSVEKNGAELDIFLTKKDAASEVNSLLVEEGAPVTSLQIQEPDLEEIFMRIMEGQR